MVLYLTLIDVSAALTTPVTTLDLILDRTPRESSWFVADEVKAFGPSKSYAAPVLSLDINVVYLYEFHSVLLPTPESAFEYNYVWAHEFDLVYEKPEGALLFKNTLPHAKLYYPEPFIASPSYMHSDLTFLCILQYWYWLWFLFIYLIAFFFLAFLTVVRWNSTHNRPRRETRGVSRSKCGDLITACVPVSWAASIIISESTDSADLNDGFGTGEIVIGVRAYQWGWEYYYPRSIDLLYNVTPSYSAFVGNSLKYNSAGGQTSEVNNLWRQYQVKSQDRPATSAGVIFNTLSSVSSAPQSSLSSSGLRTLRLSAAFPRIRNNTKIYNTHMVGLAGSSSLTSYQLASNFTNASVWAESTDFGIRRPANFISASSLLSSSLTSMDPTSFSQFLATPYTSCVDLTAPTRSSRLNGSAVASSGMLPSRAELLASPTLSDSSDKILPTDRSAISQPLTNPSMSGYRADALTAEARILDSGHADYSDAFALRLHTDTSLDPIRSAQAARSTRSSTAFSGYGEVLNIHPVESSVVINSTVNLSSLPDAASGTADKIPQGLLSLYWSSCWANMSPALRAEASASLNADCSRAYLPTFTNYADYDFRNEQALLLLEDLLWESPYSTFSYYDYLALADSCTKAEESTPIVTESSLLGVEEDLGSTSTKDSTSRTAQLSNPQSDDSLLTASRSIVSDFSHLPLLLELSEVEDQYLKIKSHAARIAEWDSNARLLDRAAQTSSSYLQVFNQFTTAYEDYGWASAHTEASELDAASSTDLPVSMGSNSSTLDVLNIRPSVKDSIVNFNAFQKVFRSRLDEGRAHANTSHFSNLAQPQPFINDFGVPYVDLLGKNRTSSFASPIFMQSPLQNFNPMSAVYSLTATQMYEFPFMDALRSDLLRYIWMDGYSKWACVDVQPASVSRYSTIGVPYLRKAYDFNTSGSEEFSDVQTYFTRASRNRKNYLPIWTYSPLLLNRHLLSPEAGLTSPLLSHECTGMGSLHSSLRALRSLHSSKVYQPSHLSSLQASNSGVSIHSKSTWRPQGAVASYHHGVSTFVDLLSRREILLRDYWFSQKNATYLPLRLTASPQNPLLREIAAAYALHDPLTFSSEASRDYVYASLSYFKFMYLKSVVSTLSTATTSLPINTSLLSDYLFFFFLDNNAQDNLPTTNELYRNQFRPLRKGISSMLRLHATGAVAMPAELRLQIMASSRDVIHSWAIPSAGIKIDCIPGYTSHRIMKFMLTGIYWGQCQEICGRYHHWMPIVVYFINRDLFFLWCTHFIYKPQSQSSWEISDRKFANYVRFISYDRSSWLAEISSL